MGLLNLKDKSTTIDETSNPIPDYPPPPYQETPSTSNAENADSSALRSPLRTLKIQYEEGKNPKSLTVFDSISKEPVFWAKMHAVKSLSGSHMEFRSTEGIEIGTAAFHRFGQARVGLTFRGAPVTMNGHFGSTYALLNFMSQAIGQRILWKKPQPAVNLVCTDTNENQMAALGFGTYTKSSGELEIFDPEIAKGGRLLEEIVVSGLAYIHLVQYMPDSAGGANTVGISYR